MTTYSLIGSSPLSKHVVKDSIAKSLADALFHLPLWPGAKIVPWIGIAPYDDGTSHPFC